MATNQGDEAQAADRAIFFNKFMNIVRQPILGVGAGNPNVVWYSGNHPCSGFASVASQLGPRTINPAQTNPATFVRGTRITSAQMMNVLNTLHGFANQITRFRNTTWRYSRTPGPDVIGGPQFTALRNTYLSAIPMPSTAAFQVAQEITFVGPVPPTAPNSAIDAFMNALRTSLTNFIAANPVQLTACHASCHSSCHGARGRR